jgi:hypothetical protein
MRKRVLVACESSGVVRQAFSARGWDAYSCDLLPSTSLEKENHIVGDVLNHLDDGWDLMISHPPCTYLTSSGMHWTTRGFRPQALTDDALKFVSTLMDAPIPHIVIENPVGRIGTAIRKADQYIKPYEYGHDASKTTGLWLKNLPLLQATKHIPPSRWACCGKWQAEGICSECGKLTKPRWGNQTPRGQDKLSPSSDRWKKRSVTYTGVANAMADQWTEYLLSSSYLSQEHRGLTLSQFN